MLKENVDETCLGCRLANQIEEVHMVYENDHIACFLDHDPINDGHLLLLPKHHCLELIDLDQEIVVELISTIQFISQVINKVIKPDGISVWQNGGIFNDLNHFHIHLIPRYKNDGFS